MSVLIVECSMLDSDPILSGTRIALFRHARHEPRIVPLHVVHADDPNLGVKVASDNLENEKTVGFVFFPVAVC